METGADRRVVVDEQQHVSRRGVRASISGGRWMWSTWLGEGQHGSVTRLAVPPCECARTTLCVIERRTTSCVPCWCSTAFLVVSPLSPPLASSPSNPISVWPPCCRTAPPSIRHARKRPVRLPPAVCRPLLCLSPFLPVALLTVRILPIITPGSLLSRRALQSHHDAAPIISRG